MNVDLNCQTCDLLQLHSRVQHFVCFPTLVRELGQVLNFNNENHLFVVVPSVFISQFVVSRKSQFSFVSVKSPEIGQEPRAK